MCLIPSLLGASLTLHSRTSELIKFVDSAVLDENRALAQTGEVSQVYIS